MDRLQGNDLKLACGVIIDRYKACIKNSLVYDVLGKGDVNGEAAQRLPRTPVRRAASGTNFGRAVLFDTYIDA